jgi:hypothetical protein
MVTLPSTVRLAAATGSQRAERHPATLHLGAVFRVLAVFRVRVLVQCRDRRRRGGPERTTDADALDENGT